MTDEKDHHPLPEGDPSLSRRGVKKEREYKNDSQQQLIRVTEYLAQDILSPKTASELSDALGLSKDQIFRTCWNLIDAAWAEESARGYRLSPKITTYGERLRLAVADTLHKYLPEDGFRTSRNDKKEGDQKNGE